MLVFALLMLILPLGAYYWSVHQAGLDLGEIKSALIAVLIVNLLLFVYIVLAFLEDSKSQKAKKELNKAPICHLQRALHKQVLHG